MKNHLNHYLPAEFPIVKRKFWDIFGVSVGPFHDAIMTAAMARIIIDVFLFDDWLHKQCGDYEDRGFSMNEIIKIQFGQEAVDLITSIS